MLPSTRVGSLSSSQSADPGAFLALANRGSEHLTAHSFTHWAVWLGCVGTCVAISFLLAEGESTGVMRVRSGASSNASNLFPPSAIPFFGDLVNLIGATL